MSVAETKEKMTMRTMSLLVSLLIVNFKHLRDYLFLKRWRAEILKHVEIFLPHR